MAIRKKAVFSNGGEYFAFVNKHGALRIWETASNSIKQEYVLSSHANLKCTALLWGPSKTDSIALNKSNIPPLEHQYLVIGTKDGEVLVYNFDEGKLCYHFESTHDKSVNDLCWHLESNCVFSCSSDQSIVIWDIATGMMKLKWEMDDGPLYSICIIDSNYLLTASDSISWWDIKKLTLIKKFNGHSSFIHTLLSVSSTDYIPSTSYFLSAAVGESKISAWHLNKNKSQKVVATFDLCDELESLDVTRTFSKDKPLLLTAVTKRGSVLLFKHVLNGKTKKNLVPQMTLHVVSKPTGEYSEPSSIPVLATKFSNCSETSTIAYGSFEYPVFEKVTLEDCPKTLTLARDKTVMCQNSSDNVMSQVALYNKLNQYVSANGKLPMLNSQYSSPKRRKHKDPDRDVSDAEEKTVEVKIPTTDSSTSSSPSKKKKQKQIDEEICIPSDSSSVIQSTLPDSSSIVNSFLQCLQTKDRACLHMVLQCNDDNTIRSSVENVPLSSLRFLLIELHKIIISPKQRYKLSSRKWLKEILNTHLHYLITYKDCVDILDLFKDFIDRQRVGETLMKMSILKGLLNIHRIQHSSRESSDSDTEEHMET